MFSLEGKKSVITGASGGIGSAIAQCFIEAGCCVTIHGRREEPLQAMASHYGDKVHIVTSDLSSDGAAGQLIKQSSDHWGGLDIVVSNAGLTRDKLLVRLKDEEWMEVLNVNLTAAMRLTRASLPMMMKQRWGRVILMSSIVGSMGNAGQSAYAAAKAGMGGFIRSVAQEVGSRGITINAIAPGFIDTPMTASLPIEIKEKYKQSIPMGHFGETKDIATSALYLASREARYVTGQILHVNGGLWMGS